MKIDDQIENEKIQHNLIEKLQISALLLGKIHKYEYLTGKKILPSNQNQTIEQAKLTYSPFGKGLGKQIKWNEYQTKIMKDKKEQTKETERQLDKYSNIEKTNLTIDKQGKIFKYWTSLFKKEKKTMSELHDAFEFDNLLDNYEDPTKNVAFCNYNNPK